MISGCILTGASTRRAHNLRHHGLQLATRVPIALLYRQAQVRHERTRWREQLLVEIGGHPIERSTQARTFATQIVSEQRLADDLERQLCQVYMDVAKLVVAQAHGQPLGTVGDDTGVRVDALGM